MDKRAIIMGNNNLKLKVDVHCPICSKMGQIHVENDFVNQVERGVTAANIAQGLVCEHSFVVYIDRNFIVRDSYICDFKIEIPEINMKISEIDNDSLDFDIDIIKLNLPPSALVNIIRGTFYGKVMVILTELEHLKSHVQNFFKYITQDTFIAQISLITRQEYKENKKAYKHSYVLDGAKVFNDRDRFFYYKNLKVEQQIVRKFFQEYDGISSLILLKNEILKTYQLSEAIVEYNDGLEEKEEFVSKKVIEYLNSRFNTVIPLPYLEFLVGIVEGYFGLDIRKPTKVADFLEFL
ncbi:MAG: hypothetical protein JW891_06080 [Candidatus Lokiarchaeota archaeon]|nr:hypothetical protein [Candidatus Lokiarchaeota archaeon]